MESHRKKPGWLRTTILLISAFWVARITGVRHWSPAHIRNLCSPSFPLPSPWLIPGGIKPLLLGNSPEQGSKLRQNPWAEMGEQDNNHYLLGLWTHNSGSIKGTIHSRVPHRYKNLKTHKSLIQNGMFFAQNLCTCSCGLSIIPRLLITPNKMLTLSSLYTILLGRNDKKISVQV
jgi:hypothetical protein